MNLRSRISANSARRPDRRFEARPQRALQGREYARHRRFRKWIVKIIVGLTLVVIVLSGLLLLAWLPAFQVRGIVVHGDSASLANVVSSDAAAQLASTVYGVIPASNIFVYSNAQLEKTLSSRFPRYKSIDIKNGGLVSTDLEITVVERAPKALWCSDIESADCFFVDDSGTIFAPADAEASNLPIVTGGVDSKAMVHGSPIATRIAEPDFSNAFAIAAHVSDRLGAVTGIAMAEHSAALQFASGVRIFTPLERSPTLISSNIDAALQADTLKGYALTDIDYLDLRFGDNRVYAKKHIGAEPQSDAASTTATSSPSQ